MVRLGFETVVRAVGFVQLARGLEGTGAEVGFAEKLFNKLLFLGEGGGCKPSARKRGQGAILVNCGGGFHA